MLWSVNSWTFGRHLGPLHLTEWDPEKQQTKETIEDYPETWTLSTWASQLSERGYQSAELSYAHLIDQDEELVKVKEAFDAAGIQIASVLLDYGDLSSSDSVRRDADIAWCKKWIEAASKLGASRVRVVAGESVPEDKNSLERAAKALCELAAYAEHYQLRVVTENIGELLSTADQCLTLLDLCKDQLGFTADYGNFTRDHLDQLEKVLPFAETVHAKMRNFPNGEPDTEDFRACLALTSASGFDGVLSLTYLGDQDPWKALVKLRSAAETELRPSQRMEA
ncbi:sugar phosphate isomerase/epimerase family protein [Paenibacillus gansuensis]|uniref:Sugar phosphate isomerase/epimerase family protein n=1 Tax=Paenibacillus gansuensis TaxID=306542 RepID=A0ABW5PF20_9BACL